jgi:hypothetical protein
MKRISALHRLFQTVAVFLLIFSVNASAHSLNRLENMSPERVLFVGNSYFYYNDSLHNHVKRIVSELRPELGADLQYKSSTIGGASLWHQPIKHLLKAQKIGVKKPFQLVILQGGSAEPLTKKRREKFIATAKEYAYLARKQGAEVAFYMVHAYVPPHKNVDPQNIDMIASTYQKIGEDNQALVIPVGLAFEKAYQLRPDIKLHKSFDGSHPSLLGTYLAACVVYLSIYGGSIDTLTYDYFGEIAAQDAAFLRGVAADTVKQFFNR